MKRFILIVAVAFLCQASAHAINTARGETPIAQPSSVIVSSVTSAQGQGLVVTSTPTSGTYSSGNFVYVTHIHIEMYATGTLTGGATPVTCTTSGLPGNPVFKFQTAEATGTDQIIDMDTSGSPWIGSTANTAVVIQCPATASVIWNLIIASYLDS